MNPKLFTPKPMMVLSIFAFLLVSYLTYHWLTQPDLTPADITSFSGLVKDASVHSDRSGGYLEITLVGQPYPFRCFSLYPKAFKFDLHGRLGPGVPVTVGVATSEVSSPRRNLVQNQQYYKFVTMSIGDTEVLPVSAYNQSVDHDRRYAPWFGLVMAVAFIWLFWVSFQAYRAGRTTMFPEDSKKVSG